LSVRAQRCQSHYFSATPRMCISFTTQQFPSRRGFSLCGNVWVLGYLLFLKTFAYSNVTKIAKLFLLCFKKYIRIILALSESKRKKHRSSAVDRQNVPANFDAEILKNSLKNMLNERLTLISYL
jgi:hypothetical protein